MKCQQRRAKKQKKSKHSLCNYFAAFALTAALTACGHYPAYLASRGDIASASENESHIDVSKLSSDDFPALAKFKNPYEVDFKGNGGNDEKLAALANIGFTNLAEVVIIDCPLVTDKSVISLSHISSITGLGLRGTSVSDKSAEILASMPKLQALTLNNSTNITKVGLLILARSGSIQDLGFSCGNLTQGDLIEIISITRRVKRIDISEPPDGRLGEPALRQVADVKGIKLYAVRNMVCSPM